MNRSWEWVEIGIQDSAAGRYWSHCSDIMKVFESGLHVKWMLGEGEWSSLDLNIFPSAGEKLLLLWSFHSVLSLPITKGPQRAAKSPPCIAATSAAPLPPLPCPHLPSWGAKITLKRPASLCRLSSCHLKKKKKATRQAAELEERNPVWLDTFQFCKNGNKKKEEKRWRSGRSPPTPTPVGRRPVAQKPRREQRESCVQQCWRGRERRRGC